METMASSVVRREMVVFLEDRRSRVFTPMLSPGCTLESGLPLRQEPEHPEVLPKGL